MIDELGRELSGVGIHGRRRERILAEFADHLACDPRADLGDPRELAGQFAAELAGDSARQTAFATFFALAGVAFAVGVPQVTLPTIPDITSGHSIWLVGAATLAMIVGAQIAFAAGCLAALRALRFDGVGDVRVVRRRIAVALAAGAATAAGSALYAVNFWGIVPDRWAILAGVSAAAAAIPLAVASFSYTRTGGIEVRDTAPARGLSADLGPLARPSLIGAAAALLMLVGTSVAESSVIQGAIRAGFEAALFVSCFFVFRRPLTLTP